MSTQVLLILAGPTPWDAEERVVGRQPLPLTAQAVGSIRQLLDAMPAPIDHVYCARGNESCAQTARLVADKFRLRPRHNADLDEWNLGLWEGLTLQEMRFRFPSVFEQWQEDPLTIRPPEGEELSDAIARVQGAVKKIVRRNRGDRVALAMRPVVMQIARAMLSRRPPQDFLHHLREAPAAETIELPDPEWSQLTS
jgi:broad specificity phosphatase PhoE